MLVGARLNWLLSHGKGKMVGDIGSCVRALLEATDGKWQAPPAEWTSAIDAKKQDNIAKMAPKLAGNPSPMDFHSALGALRTVIKERPDIILVNEGNDRGSRSQGSRQIPD